MRGVARHFQVLKGSLLIVFLLRLILCSVIVIVTLIIMNAIHSISLTEMDVDAALEFNINQQLEVNGIKELTK